MWQISAIDCIFCTAAMTHTIYMGFLCISLVLVILCEASAKKGIREETQKEKKVHLKDIFSGRMKRQLEELCQQSPAGCIMQSEFSEDSTQNGKRKRKKSKKEKKHGSRGRKNKRKMSTSSEINHETDETCPYVDPPTDDEDYEEDDGSECLKTQQIIGD